MKSILVLLALSLSVSAFAQDRRQMNGRLDLRDGSTIVRINVGSDRESDSRENSKRIASLERAVRELQNRVYDLEDETRPSTREVTVYACSLKSAFKGTFLGKGTTEVEAKTNAVQKCIQGSNNDAFFCGEERIGRCDISKEIVRD